MSAVRVTTSLSPRVFFSMDSPQLCHGSTVIERVRTDTSGVVTCWQDSIVATGQTDPRGARVNRRDRPLQSCRRSAVLGKRTVAPQASCPFRIRSKKRVHERLRGVLKVCAARVDYG